MGSFMEKLGLNSKEKELIIGSPMKGEVCPLSEVNDPVFGEKILGDGLAIKPLTGKLVAPVNGTVGMLFDTKHAISLISEQGAEVLIHVGLDTVNLKGKFYKSFVKTGDKVKAGDLLLEFDIEQIKAAGYDVITPVIICNTAAYSEIIPVTGKRVEELEKILTIKK